MTIQDPLFGGGMRAVWAIIAAADDFVALFERGGVCDEEIALEEALKDLPEDHLQYARSKEWRKQQ